MDVMIDPGFWGEVGLAAAARLAVLAAVVWVARMVLARTAGTPGRRFSGEDHTSATSPRKRMDVAFAPAPAAAFFNLKPHPGLAAGTVPRSVTRDRLMDYLKQRSAERTTS